MSFLPRKCAKKLSYRRIIIKSLFEKLYPAVNYGTERYTFSHKSVVLSAVVRCKYSFYFFGKSFTRLVSVSKNTFEHKKTFFFQKSKLFDRFVENTLSRTDESWYKTREFMNFAQLWRGWRYFIHLIFSLLHYYGRVKINFFASQKSQISINWWALE